MTEAAGGARPDTFDRPDRGRGRRAPAAGPGQHGAAVDDTHLCRHRARERLHLRQQRAVPAGLRAGRRGPALRRLRLARRHQHQHRGGHLPGGPSQAGARQDRPADTADRQGRPRRRGTPRRSRGAGGRRPHRGRGRRPDRGRWPPDRGPPGSRRVTAHRRVGHGAQAGRRRGLLRQLPDGRTGPLRGRDRRRAPAWPAASRQVHVRSGGR